jgi:hypothetical protein
VIDEDEPIPCAACDGTGTILASPCISCDGADIQHVTTKAICPDCLGGYYSPPIPRNGEMQQSNHSIATHVAMQIRNLFTVCAPRGTENLEP